LDVDHATRNGYGDYDFKVTQSLASPSDLSRPDSEPGSVAPSPGEEPGELPSAAPADPLLSHAARSLEALSEEFPQSAGPTRGPTRWLRMLTGVDETLLSRVWEERARYTGLGAIVLGTALMATFSMSDALDQALGPVWPVLIIGALFWGTFICCIDRWLISSTHGVRSSRWKIFLPRLVMALLFGIIIATPLVLTIFGSAIVSRAHDDQQNAVTTYGSQLKSCNPLPNPVTGAVAAPPSWCGQLTLPIPDPAIGLTQTIAQEKAQRDLDGQTLAADNQRIERSDVTVRDECNGVSGQGLSGIPGVGPNCERDRQQENNFEQQNNVGQLEAQLTSLNQKIAGQGATVGTETQAYSNAITTAISDKVSTRQDNEGRIGLLNRIDALGELISSNAVIAVATVLLGLFVLMVDCLPVLSKLMSGTTRYDQLVEHRLRTAEKVAAGAMRVSERHMTGSDEVAFHSIESEIRARLERIDEESRVGKARRDAELSRQIAELAAEYRRSAP
jgi:hypothetical protein